MRGIGRLVFVSGVAIASFVAAVISFREPPASECQMAAVSNPAYEVRLEEAPEVNLTSYHLLVTRNDQPVQGAVVCMRLDMGGRGNMSGMAASNVAREVSPGRYEVEVRLVMSGPWQGTTIVTEPGQRPVSIPMNVEVS